MKAPATLLTTSLLALVLFSAGPAYAKAAVGTGTTAVAPTPTPATHAFDLKKAAEYALANSPDFQAIEKRRSIAGLEKANARSAFLPSLDASLSAGLQGAEPDMPSSPYASAFALTLTENLYDNGVSLTRYEQTKLRERASDIEFRRDRDRLLLELADRFLDVGLTVKLVEAQQAQLDLVQKQFRLGRAQYRSGFGSQRDYLRLESTLRRTELSLMSARLRQDKARQALLAAMGAPLDSGFAFADISEQKPPATDVTPKIETHFESQLAEIENEIQSLSTELVRRRFGPELDLKLTGAYGASDFIGTGRTFGDNDRTEGRALLTLSMNLLDWGLRRRNIEIASAQESIGQSQRSSRLINTRLEIDQLVRDLREARESFRLSEELLGLEEKTFASINRDYREGRQTFLEFSDALRNLLDAKNRFYESRSRLTLLVLRHRYHEGTLHENLVR